jgi:hypothetical protein
MLTMLAIAPIVNAQSLVVGHFSTQLSGSVGNLGKVLPKPPENRPADAPRGLERSCHRAYMVLA